MSIDDYLRRMSECVAEAALESANENHAVAAIATQAAMVALTFSALRGLPDAQARAAFEAAMAAEQQNLQELLRTMLTEEGIVYPTPSA